jgi:alpha-beta hydrolase superfamily lysophospholipase
MTGAPAKAIFTGASGNRLIADVFGESGPSVLLLHRGGQTRHAWRKTAERLAQAGWTAYALDQRGHGDSEWVAEAAYAFADFADVAEARHMVAGDSNENFSAATLEFLGRNAGEAPDGTIPK